MFFNSIKEINMLISNEFQIFTIKKNWRSLNFDVFGKKIWRNALALKSKRHKVYSGKRLFWHYHLQLSFFYKTVSQISFIFFVWEIKGLELISETYLVSQNILATK